jgi:hypothetical protein
MEKALDWLGASVLHGGAPSVPTPCNDDLECNRAVFARRRQAPVRALSVGLPVTASSGTFGGCSAVNLRRNSSICLTLPAKRAVPHVTRATAQLRDLASRWPSWASASQRVSASAPRAFCHLDPRSPPPLQPTSLPRRERPQAPASRCRSDSSSIDCADIKPSRLMSTKRFLASSIPRRCALGSSEGIKVDPIPPVRYPNFQTELDRAHLAAQRVRYRGTW